MPLYLTFVDGRAMRRPSCDTVSRLWPAAWAWRFWLPIVASSLQCSSFPQVLSGLLRFFAIHSKGGLRILAGAVPTPPGGLPHARSVVPSGEGPPGPSAQGNRGRFLMRLDQPHQPFAALGQRLEAGEQFAAMCGPAR